MPYDRLISVSDDDPTPKRTAGGAADGDVVTWVDANQRYEPMAPGGGPGSDDQTAAEVPFTPVGTIAATDTQAAVAEVATDAASALSTHAAAGDPHTGYRLESADHSHASTGAQGGVVAASAISFTPAGSIAATTVQAAIEEVASEAGAGTSVATDGIWAAAGDIAVATGNDAAAVLGIGAAGGAVSRVNGAVAWNSGTSNPGAAAAGDRYWRSDLGLEIYYDGTRWLTTKLYLLSLSDKAGQQTVGLSANGAIATAGAFGGAFDVWMVTLYVTAYVVTTNDGSKYWTISLIKNLTTGDTSIASVNTSAVAADGYRLLSVSIGAALGTLAGGFYLSCVKTSTPGALFGGGTLAYRRIVT